MILLSLSCGVSFFSPSFKGPPEELAFVNFASADEVLFKEKKGPELFLKDLNAHIYCAWIQILTTIIRQGLKCQ